MKDLPEDIQEKIIAYIDGDLSPSEAAAVEVYLANADPGLSEMVVGMMADRHSLSVLPKVSAPSDLSARIMDQLERESLLHNVEDDIVRPLRPWWQSKAAIAAGLALVVGGFSYFVIQSIYRTDRPTEIVSQQNPDSIATTPTPEIAKAPGVGGQTDDGMARNKAMDIAATPAPIIIGKDGARPGGGGGRGGAGGGGGFGGGAGQKRSGDNASAHDDLNRAANDIRNNDKANGVPLALVLDTSETVEQKLERDRKIFDEGVDAAKKAGYIEAATCQVALANVYAGPQAPIDGPPVLVSVVARDAKDMERLEARLSSFMQNGRDAEVNWQRAGAREGDKAKTEAELQKNLAQKLTESKKDEPGGVPATSAPVVQVSQGKAQGPVSPAPASPAKDEQSAATGVSPPNETVAAKTPTPSAPAAGSSIVRAPATELPPVKPTEVAAPGNSQPTQTITNTGINTVANGNQLERLVSGNTQSQIHFDSNAGQYAGIYRTLRPPTYSQATQKAATQDYVNEKFANDQFAGQVGQPFRVFLRPEQLDQVASEFNVFSVKRGRVAYVIPQEEAHLGKFKERVDGKAAATAPAIAEGENRNSTARFEPAQQAAQRKQSVQGQQAGMGYEANDNSDQWIEVIIAIQPPPSARPAIPGVRPEAQMNLSPNLERSAPAKGN